MRPREPGSAYDSVRGTSGRSQEIEGGNAELLCECVNRVKREVPLSPFDTRQVSGRYSELFSELLLSQTPGTSKVAHACAENLLERRSHSFRLS